MSGAARLVAIAVAIAAGAGAAPGLGAALPFLDRLPVWFDIIAAVACVRGGARLVADQAHRPAGPGDTRRGPPLVVAAFAATLAAGLLKLGAPSWETPLLDHATWFARIEQAVYAPVLAALLASLAWHAAAAARRALRARVRGARVFAGSAAVVVLGHIPAADGLVAACPPPFDALLPSRAAAWLVSGPVAAGERALLAGAALGAIAAAVSLLGGRADPAPLAER